MLQKARQIARHSADVSEDDVSEDEHVSGDTQCGSDTCDVTRISLPSVEEFNISTPSLVFLPVFIQARICIDDRAFFQGGKSEKN